MQVLAWTSKVQYKRSTPYIALIKHLRDRIPKGSVVSCELCVDDDEVYVKVYVNAPPYGAAEV